MSQSHLLVALGMAGVATAAPGFFERPLIMSRGAAEEVGAADACSNAVTLNNDADIYVGNETYWPGVVLTLQRSCEGAGSFSTSVEAITRKGGLVQAFRFNEKNLLFNSNDSAIYDGHIFWPAPQSGWGWPPKVEIDPTPSGNFEIEYTLETDNSETNPSFTLTSPNQAELGIQVSKRISIDVDAAAVVFDYTIENTGPNVSSWAPWEVTRVGANGITFWKRGELEPWGFTWDAPYDYPPRFQHAGGVTWFEHKDTLSGKLFADTGKGWLAHTDGTHFFVKCFDKIPNSEVAPEEAQIEIYDGSVYVELENQGAYVQLAPGEELRWNVRWFTREMPSEARFEVGNAELVAFANTLCPSDESAARCLYGLHVAVLLCVSLALFGQR